MRKPVDVAVPLPVFNLYLKECAEIHRMCTATGIPSGTEETGFLSMAQRVAMLAEKVPK